MLKLSLRRRFLLSIAWMLVGIGAGGSNATARDWPEFRGPTGQGHADANNLPLTWSPRDNVVWTTPLPGAGWSSPIVVGKRVYLTTAVEVDGTESEAPAATKEGKSPGHSLRALAIDLESGNVAWNNEIFYQPLEQSQKIHAKNSRASPTPVFDGERLYVHFGPRTTAALDLDGKILWKNDRIDYQAQHGAGGSPVSSGDLLFFHCDGVEKPFVVALDKSTGEEKWRTYRPETSSQRFSFATPLEIVVDGKKQLVSPGSSFVCSYDPQTGNEIWRVGFSTRWSVIPRPVFAEGLVFACTGYEGPPDLLAIRPNGTGDVTATHVAWKTDKSAPHTPSPVAADGALYMVSDEGVATCLDAATGKVHWRERLGGNFSASPLYCNGRVYFADEEGVCTVVRAGDEFEQLARNDLEEATLASFAVVDNALLIRTQRRLYRIEEGADR